MINVKDHNHRLTGDTSPYMTLCIINNLDNLDIKLNYVTGWKPNRIA